MQPDKSMGPSGSFLAPPDPTEVLAATGFEQPRQDPWQLFFTQTQESIKKNVNRQNEVIANMQEIIQQLNAQKLQQPQREQIAPSEAGTAGLVALIGKLLGARDQYVMGSLNQYMQGREGQLDRKHQQESLAANQQFAADRQGLLSQYDMNKFELNNLEDRLGVDQKQLAEASDLIQSQEVTERSNYAQDQLNARNDATIKDRQARQLLDLESKDKALYNKVKSKVQIALELGYTPEEARRYAMAEYAKQIAEAERISADEEYTKARTQTENEHRPLKAAEIKAKVDKARSDIEKNKAMTSVHKARAKQILEGMEVAELSEESVGVLLGLARKDVTDPGKVKAAIQELENTKAKIKKQIISAKATLLDLETDEEKSLQKELIAELEADAKRINDMLFRVNEESKKLTKAAVSGARIGGNAPVNPFEVSPTLKGKIGK